jgi:hypothetical protein
MKLRLTAVTTVVLLFFAGLAYSQSLGDLAKKEKERREKLKNESKPITNKDTSKYKNSAITTGSPPAAASAKAEAEKPAPEAAKPAKVEPDEPVDLLGRPESFWRQTMSDARQKVKDLENEANVLTLKLADLQTQFYRESDGFRQQQIQREIQKTIYEQDVNKENLAKARTQLQELETEGRKSGALPGWLAPRTH